MATRHLIAATSLAALLAGVAPAFAQTAVVATADLNVRAGPGPNYPVVGVIRDQGSATLDGCLQNSKWCRVDAGGVDGWAYSDYLAADLSGTRVVVTERRQDIGVPVVTYDKDAGGAVAGAATGAVAGALIGGPVGAAVGGAAGLAAGAAVEPPETAVTYVRGHEVQPVYLEGEAVIGSRLPDVVELQPIPDYNYDYVYVNGQPVLVDPSSRQVVYVIRQ